MIPNYFTNRTYGQQFTSSGTSGVITDGAGVMSTTGTNFYPTNTLSSGILGPFIQLANTTIGGGSSGTAGTITLTGTRVVNNLIFNTPFAGAYTLTGGTLKLVTETGANTTAPATITVNGIVPVTITSTTITNPNGFFKAGLGTLIIGSNNTYTGATTVSAGTLQLAGVNSWNSPVTVKNTASLTTVVTGSSASNAAGSWTFESGATWNNDQTLGYFVSYGLITVTGTTPTVTINCLGTAGGTVFMADNGMSASGATINLNTTNLVQGLAFRTNNNNSISNCTFNISGPGGISVSPTTNTRFATTTITGTSSQATTASILELGTNGIGQYNAGAVGNFSIGRLTGYGVVDSNYASNLNTGLANESYNSNWYFTGVAGVIQAGTGTIQFQNRYGTSTGAVSVTGTGTLIFGDGTYGSMPTGAINVTSGSTLNYNSPNNVTTTGAVTGVGLIIKNSGSTWTMNGTADSFSGSMTINNGSVVHSLGTIVPSTLDCGITYVGASTVKAANLTLGLSPTLSGITLNVHTHAGTVITAGSYAIPLISWTGDEIGTPVTGTGLTAGQSLLKVAKSVCLALGTVAQWDSNAVADSAVTDGAGTWNTALTQWTADSGTTNTVYPGAATTVIFGGGTGTFLMSASSIYSAAFDSFKPVQAVPSDWATLGQTTNYWLAVWMKTPVRISSFMVRGRVGFPTEVPATWRLEASNDGTTWTPIYNSTTTILTTVDTTITVDSLITYQYYRIFGITSPVGSANPGLNKFQLYNFTGGAAVIPAMTSNNNAGPAGVVTVTGTIGVNNFTFVRPASGNYTFNGGTLSLPGTGCVINTFSGAAPAFGTTVLSGTSIPMYISGTGTLSIASSNTFTGTVDIHEGTTVINSATALGNRANAITVYNSAQLQVGSNVSPAYNITLNGSGSSLTAGALYVNGGTLTVFSGNIILASDSTVSTNGSTFGISGPITGTNVNLDFYAGGGGLINITNSINVGTGFIRTQASNTGTIVFTGTCSSPIASLSGTFRMNRLAMFGGTTASWTAANIICRSGASISHMVSGTNAFTASDLAITNGLNSTTGGWQNGSLYDVSTINGNATLAWAPVNFATNTKVYFRKVDANTLTLTSPWVWSEAASQAQVNGGTLELAGGGNVSTAIQVNPGATLRVTTTAITVANNAINPAMNTGGGGNIVVNLPANSASVGTISFNANAGGNYGGGGSITIQSVNAFASGATLSPCSKRYGSQSIVYIQADNTIDGFNDA